MARIPVCALLLLICAGAPLYGGTLDIPPLLLTDEREHYRLREHIAVLEDPQGRLSFTEVRAAQSGWEELRFRRANYGLSSSVYWVRFRVRNASSLERFVLELGYPNLDRVRLYCPRPGGGYLVKESGDLIPFAERDIAHRSILFHLRPLDYEPVYLRIASRGTVKFPLTLHAPKRFAERNYRLHLFLGLFYGFIASLLLYNLFLGLTLRERSYLLYVGYLLFFLLFQMIEDGVAYQLFWPGHPWFANRVGPLTIALAMATVLAFTADFTGVCRLYRPLEFLYILLYAALGGMVGAVLLGLDYRIMIRVGVVLLFLTAPTIYGSALLALVKGYRPARFMVLSWSIFVIVLILGNAEVGGILRSHFFEAYGVKIGAALETLLLSFALADRFNFLRNERERLYRLSTEDGLTKLVNRLHFDNLFRMEAARAQRHGTQLAVIMIDIDYFKRINDTYGHKTGDAVLRRVAEVLAQHTRETEVLARYGGEEFVILLPETGQSGAMVKAERLRRAIEESTFVCRERKERITISLGVSGSDRAERLFIHLGGEALLEGADQAMYRAKRAGRNRVCGARFLFPKPDTGEPLETTQNDPKA